MDKKIATASDAQKMDWASPQLTRYGTIEELTGQSFDKVGTSFDYFTELLPSIDGSIIPAK